MTRTLLSAPKNRRSRTPQDTASISLAPPHRASHKLAPQKYHDSPRRPLPTGAAALPKLVQPSCLPPNSAPPRSPTPHSTNRSPSVFAIKTAPTVSQNTFTAAAPNSNPPPAPATQKSPPHSHTAPSHSTSPSPPAASQSVSPDPRSSRYSLKDAPEILQKFHNHTNQRPLSQKTRNSSQKKALFRIRSPSIPPFPSLQPTFFSFPLFFPTLPSIPDSTSFPEPSPFQNSPQIILACQIIIKTIIFLIDHSEYNCYKYHVLDRSDCNAASASRLNITNSPIQQDNEKREIEPQEGR